MAPSRHLPDVPDNMAIRWHGKAVAL